MPQYVEVRSKQFPLRKDAVAWAMSEKKKSLNIVRHTIDRVSGSEVAKWEAKLWEKLK